MKYSDTSFTSEDESGKIKKGIKSIEPETKPETVKDPTMEVADAGNQEPDQEKSSPLSLEAPEDRAEMEDSAKAEAEAPEVPIPASKVTSVGEESSSQAVEVEQVATKETNTEAATENVDDKSEKKVDNGADSVAVLAKIEAEITETDHELEAVLKNLKNRRKRSHSGDNKFHGWAKGDIKVAKTGYTVVATTDFPSGVDGAGASFGMSDIDLISFNSEVGESLLEVIFSDPILRDVRKLELKGPGGPAPAVAETAAGKVTRTNKKIVELDTDDRAGSNSPDSYGSSKENDPELCNSVSSVFKQSKSKAYATRKKGSLKNPLVKPALEMS